MKSYISVRKILLFLWGCAFSLSIFANQKPPVFETYVNAGLIYKVPTAYGFKYVARQSHYWYCIWEKVPVNECS